MKNYINKIIILLLLSVVIISCDKKDTDFRNFFDNKEITYPGVASKVFTRSGKYRAQILFNPSPDPNVAEYIVYWNNKKDSLVIPSTIRNTADTVKISIPNLQEYVYSFTIYSKDKSGNRSVPLQVNNLKVYGDIYENGLYSRAYDATNPYVYDVANNSLRLKFLKADTLDGFNVDTKIQYTNNVNATIEKVLKPQDTLITLNNYKRGSKILYKSSFLPTRTSLDTFYVKQFAEYPPVYVLEQCDKSKFAEVYLDKDVKIYNGDECPVRKLWDGSVGPQGYPNIFHSADGSKMPQVFTFDMGKTYERLSQIEETGRNCCNTTLRFEVWGIDDLTNAKTTLDASEMGWKEESISKGWTLLKEVIRPDDGKAAMKFSLMDNPPPVRYIRIRIIQAQDSNSTSSMSELTFWSKQL